MPRAVFYCGFRRSGGYRVYAAQAARYLTLPERQPEGAVRPDSEDWFDWGPQADPVRSGALAYSLLLDALRLPELATFAHDQFASERVRFLPGSWCLTHQQIEQWFFSRVALTIALPLPKGGEADA
jgi:hypothetical protein